MEDSPAYEIQRVLQEMRDEYWRSLEAEEASESGETVDYLVVRLGGERFGIATDQAREVLRMPRLVRVPQVPGHIPGVINLRGQILAVTDLRPLLSLKSSESNLAQRLVVVEAGGLSTALLVELVEGIHTVPREAIEPLSGSQNQQAREAFSGQMPFEDGLLLLLDLPRLLAQQQLVFDQKGE